MDDPSATLVRQSLTDLQSRLLRQRINTQQLLGRYTTGREGRGIVIAYVRKKNISDLVKGIRQKMDAELPCNQQGVTTDHLLKWSFLSTHAHSCGESLEVSHVGCNLFVEASS